MYTAFQLAKKYIRYYFTASNGKGHGIHSPFVFQFVQEVLHGDFSPPVYDQIEQQRKKLLQNDQTIEVEDFGAGSGHLKYKIRKIKDIASTSLKPKKYASLLGRLVKHFSPETVTELGTSLGITTMYLAATGCKVATFEGSENIAEVARENFAENDFSDIKIITGPFEKTLPSFIAKNQKADFVFLDGNHKKKPTLEYFELFLKNADEHSIFVFDDIHWSEEMEAAWELVKQHEAVTLSIDLFFIGVVFLRKDFKIKQHFIIRY